MIKHMIGLHIHLRKHSQSKQSSCTFFGRSYFHGWLSANRNFHSRWPAYRNRGRL